MLLHGDCIKRMDDIDDESVDMIMCDPPYEITQCKWDSIIDLKKMWQQLNRVCSPNAAIVFTAAQPFTTLLISSNPEMFKYCMVWKKNRKTGFLNAKIQPLRQTEDIVVFYRKQCTYNPIKTTGHPPVNSFTKNTSDGETLGRTKTGIKGGGQTDRYPTNIIEIDGVNNDGSKEKRYHPSQKPVALMEYLIKTYSNEGDVVLDFAMGSGTTGVACQNLNRIFVGIEKDLKYFNIAVDRISHA